MKQNITMCPAGDSGVLVCFGTAVSEEINAMVSGLSRTLLERPLAGMVETVPAFAALLVRYDPLLTEYDTVCAGIRNALEQPAAAGTSGSKTVEIPVCYGGEYGPDLGFIASHAGLTEEEVIALHSGRTYPIYMLGFLPGFPYLGGLNERIFTPRLQNPRTSIPAGSVGIGGQQTGIYPMASPGGWQLLGRTPLKLFDPQNAEKLPYRAGDQIKFYPISQEEFLRLAEKEGTL